MLTGMTSRISHIDFTDLTHDIEKTTADRAFIKCELIVLRARDKGRDISEQEHELLSAIPNEIHELARKFDTLPRVTKP